MISWARMGVDPGLLLKKSQKKKKIKKLDGEIKPCAKTEISESMRMQAFIYTNVALFFFFLKKLKLV